MEGFSINSAKDVYVGNTLAKYVYIGNIKIWDYKTSQSAPTAYGDTVPYNSTACASASGGGGYGSIEWSNGQCRSAIGSQNTKARWSGDERHYPSDWSNEVTLTVYDPEWVDLGLPSGLKWRNRNIGADTEEDAGLLFAWGEITGYANAAARNAALGGTKGFGADNYTNSGAYNISEDLTSTNDAATVILGNGARMPTRLEIQELVSNCSYSWQDRKGLLFTSNINQKTLFIPANSFAMNNNVVNPSTGGFWSASNYSNGEYGNAYKLYIASIGPDISMTLRFFGSAIRAVK